MKKRLLPVFIAALLIGLKSIPAHAQPDSLHKRYTVAVFAPLFLDSAFDASGEYRYDKSFPKFINPGLEFYEGVKMAADSLKIENVPLDIAVFDTRSTTESLQQQLQSPLLENAGIYIGHVTAADARIIAAAARQKNIPFVNANLPNDAGITGNPSLVILNSTLQTHCEAIYRYLQRNYPVSSVVFLRKKGAMEDRLQSYFSEAEKNIPGSRLKIKYVLVDDSKPLSIRSNFDSTRLVVSIVGSLDESFGKKIASEISAMSASYPNLLVGMPTWDAITDFTRPEYKGVNIVYTTPFYSARIDKVSLGIISYFKDFLYARPSDMVFRGYECMYRFGKLLLENGANLNTSIGEKKFQVFTDWDIQPVLDKQTLSLDHFENKKIYFVKKTDGIVKQVQ